MPIVLDTNVWVSGMLWRGAPWRVLQLAESGAVTIWATPAIILEIQTTLNYPRLQPRLQVLGVEVSDLMAYALALASLIEPATITPVVVDDPDDDMFLACALAASATYLVSGDRHLLALGTHEHVLIVPPHEFLAREFPPSPSPPT